MAFCGSRALYGTMVYTTFLGGCRGREDIKTRKLPSQQLNIIITGNYIFVFM